MGIQAELKSINELVKEGYEVTVDEDDIYITGKKTHAGMNLGLHYDHIDYKFDLTKDKDDDDYYEVDDTHGFRDGDSIHKAFLKNIENTNSATIELKNHTLVLSNDGSIKVGCETIDAKLGLQIAKAIMKANGYDITG